MHLSWFKYSLLLYFLSLFNFSSFANSDNSLENENIKADYSNYFLMNECLNYDFTVKVSHPSHLFGLLKTELSIKKDKCLLNVEQKKFLFVKKGFQVDVCRGPIHIKENANLSGVEIHKKANNCSYLENPKKKDSFCQSWEKISSMIQDDGLIFAEGEKEDMSSDHGKVYCSFQLLLNYAEENKILGRPPEESGDPKKDIKKSPPPKKFQYTDPFKSDNL